MANQFYTAFDTAPLEPVEPRPDEYRTPFAINRDRVIHSSSFRRLQGKTQVFLAGDYDFYRTRLTHSIEVAQIGRAICSWLQHSSPGLGPEFFIDPDLVEAACLAHDLGHPPFGHAGERTLHRLMQPWGGFEGNAQTLRLLAHTLFAGGTRGMNPTRALLDGVLKYKTLAVETPEAAHHFIYTEQASLLDFVTAGEAFPATLTPGKTRNAFRAIECQIMDWADDTAYSLNDLADGVNAGFLTADRITRWAEEKSVSADGEKSLARLLDSLRHGKLEGRNNRKIGDYISACRLVPNEGFLSAQTRRHAFRLEIDPAAAAESKLFKALAFDLVFRHPSLQQLDHRADLMLTRLFEVLTDRYLAANPSSTLHLLPPAVETALAAAPTEAARARLLCDQLARLTDHAATRLYLRLFDPRFGSISDLV